MSHCKTEQGDKACLMTSNGGEHVDTQRKTFKPDFGIEHTRVKTELSFLGWCLVVGSVACLVWFGAERIFN